MRLGKIREQDKEGVKYNRWNAKTKNYIYISLSRRLCFFFFSAVGRRITMDAGCAGSRRVEVRHFCPRGVKRTHTRGAKITTYRRSPAVRPSSTAPYLPSSRAVQVLYRTDPTREACWIKAGHTAPTPQDGSTPCRSGRSIPCVSPLKCLDREGEIYLICANMWRLHAMRGETPYVPPW